MMDELPLVSTPMEAPAAAHLSLKAQCEARKVELEEALRHLNGGSETTRRDIEVAIDALNGLLTGNLDQIPPMVAGQLSKWIASSKYLGAKETREMAAAVTADAKVVAGAQFDAPDAD